MAVPKEFRKLTNATVVKLAKAKLHEYGLSLHFSAFDEGLRGKLPNDRSNYLAVDEPSERAFVRIYNPQTPGGYDIWELGFPSRRIKARELAGLDLQIFKMASQQFDKRDEAILRDHARITKIEHDVDAEDFNEPVSDLYSEANRKLQSYANKVINSLDFVTTDSFKDTLNTLTVNDEVSNTKMNRLESYKRRLRDIQGYIGEMLDLCRMYNNFK